MTPIDVVDRFPDLATGEQRHEDAHRRRSTKARAPTPRSKAWPS